MVDRKRRDALAELLRHFIAGQLTNDEFEDRLDVILDDPRPVRQWEDPALWAIRSETWLLYDDLRTHRLKGKWAIPAEGREHIARWILFLHSDYEYEWPATDFISLRSCMLSVLTLGLARLVVRRRVEALGDWDVWPFIRRSDYEQATAHPRLLRG